MPPLMLLMAVAAALIIGIASGYYLRYLHALSKKSSVEIDLKEKTLHAEEKALKIVEKAEAKADEIENEFKAERKEKEGEIKAKEERLNKKEELLDDSLRAQLADHVSIVELHEGACG